LKVLNLGRKDNSDINTNNKKEKKRKLIISNKNFKIYYCNYNKNNYCNKNYNYFYIYSVVNCNLIDYNVFNYND